ncbi:GH116 family glycosyl-hydrolase [Flavobacterium algicola]|uniref:GH116 family glycosyl-hydrolase n=1 Tax=Flavobacterium algicola TaxID=556529 RepID=UPI001EFE9B3E|nr:GH116 family glycosyl-hydrolase [Flavobacterium algicola]MCG9792346.1 non-lysosomal glucosylceramidase [Flavobacterium algicola]
MKENWIKSKVIIISLAYLIMGMTNSYGQQSNWPTLKTYEKDFLQRIAMPIGGIGTGTISLKGNGALQDWEIMSSPAKGFNPWLLKGPPVNRAPFFAIYIKEENKRGQAILLEGPPTALDYEGDMGAKGTNHGFPRFEEAVFKTAYPFGQVQLKDNSLPIEVSMGAFNPLIPGDVDDSSIPMAVLIYSVKNTSNKPITIAIAGTIENFIGFDGSKGKAIKNVNSIKEINGIRGINYTSNGVNKDSEQWGTFSLATISEGQMSYRTNWTETKWGDTTLDFWDDFTDDGLLEDRKSLGEDAPMGSVAVKTTLKSGEQKDIKFLITWAFPNRSAWRNTKANVGNYYATKYIDSWDVLEQTVPKLAVLENKTVEFVNTVIKSDFPTIVKEAALFNLAHLRTQLAFRTKEGYMLGWEGTSSNAGRGIGSCTHVWNYDQTTPFLFGELAKTMRDTEFGFATDENGLMSFRIDLPLKTDAQKWGAAAADGQMGSIMKFYREWKLSGDDEFLKSHWPKVKKALEFAWIKGGWDANKDGVMEGAQHNTMDVEYFGPNPQMGFWYLGALRATEEMAKYLGEKSFAKTCRSLYKNGSSYLDEKLFNGEYYEQEIVPPMLAENVANGLIKGLGAKDLTSPDYQLGKGVLVDQLVGQVMAHILDLGYLANKENMTKTNNAIIKYNHLDSMLKHPNFMRSYALGDEAALVMAGYPGERPKKPFPYFTEVMTGFEYTAAVGMLYENQFDMGFNTMQDVRDRYDGKKRNPYNEAEFGNHYARSMMAWGGILAITGFNYSAVDHSMKFNAKNGNYFWSNGYQYGSVTICGTENEKNVSVKVINGTFNLNSFSLHDFGKVEFKKGKLFEQGKIFSFNVKKSK